MVGSSPRVGDRRFLSAVLICCGLLPSLWVLLCFGDAPQLGMVSDDVMYLGAAHSIIEGNGYRESALPGQPWQTKYPPGYPLALTAILKLASGPANLLIIAHSWLWLAVASFCLAWAMRRAGLTDFQAACVAAVWAANPAAVSAGTLALSDAPYCALVFLAIGLAHDAAGGRLLSAGVAGMVVALASSFRTAALLVGGGIFVWLVLVKKKPRSAGVFSLCAAPLPTIWMIWSRAHLPRSPDPVTTFYLDYTGRWLDAICNAGLDAVVFTNATHGVMAMGGLLVASTSVDGIRILRDIGLLALSVFSLRAWSGGAFAAVALVIVAFQMFWHFAPDSRLLLVSSPVLLSALGQRWFHGRRRGAYWIFLLPVAVVVGAGDVQGVRAIARNYEIMRCRQAAMSPAYVFIRHETPAGAAILGDEMTWLYTDRPTIGMPVPMEYFYRGQKDAVVDEFLLKYWDVVKRFDIDYILLTPWDFERSVEEKGERVHKAMRSDPRLRRVFSMNGIELFFVEKLGGVSP